MQTNTHHTFTQAIYLYIRLTTLQESRAEHQSSRGTRSRAEHQSSTTAEQRKRNLHPCDAAREGVPAEEAKGQSHVRRSRGTRQAATICSNRRPGGAQIGGCGGME